MRAASMHAACKWRAWDPIKEHKEHKENKEHKDVDYNAVSLTGIA